MSQSKNIAPKPTDRKFDPSMTDAELLDFWAETDPGIKSGAVAGGRYYDAGGNLYRYTGNSYWQGADGKWYEGTPSGEIANIPAPPWEAGGDTSEPPPENQAPPADETVPVLQPPVPTYDITPEQVQEALQSQDGSIQAGMVAQAAVAQQEANEYAQRMIALGLSEADAAAWQEQVLNKTGWTYDTLAATFGWTVEQIDALSGYFRAVNLYNVSVR